jgi:hypothetical protein
MHIMQAISFHDGMVAAALKWPAGLLAALVPTGTSRMLKATTVNSPIQQM